MKGCPSWSPRSKTVTTWKWLLASRGAGLFYTTPKLREKLRDTMVGGAMMKHRGDYLNLDWDPFESARRFEYSTVVANLRPAHAVITMSAATRGRAGRTRERRS